MSVNKQKNFVFFRRKIQSTMTKTPARLPFGQHSPFAHPVTFATERLRLRPIVLTDAPAVLTIYSDPIVGKYNSWAPITDLGGARTKIAHFQRQFTEQELLRWGLARKTDDRIIGDCMIIRIDERSHKAEVGFNLARDCWRQGYMREAASAIIAYAFQTIGLNRLEGYVIPENTPSAGLLQRLGFTREGHLREATINEGHYADLELWALLYRDYSGQSPAKPD